MSAITTEQMLALITAQSKQIEALTAAVERLSMATPTKVVKTVRKRTSPSAHTLYLKAKAAELGINYKQAMCNKDVISEWKNSSELVEKCRAEAAELKENAPDAPVKSQKPKGNKRMAKKLELAQTLNEVAGKTMFSNEEIEQMTAQKIREHIKAAKNGTTLEEIAQKRAEKNAQIEQTKNELIQAIRQLNPDRDELIQDEIGSGITKPLNKMSVGALRKELAQWKKAEKEQEKYLAAKALVEAVESDVSDDETI
tara:strand:+ start:14836 stop:15600 length:765 start_codon:yes stop_codon:yes gene_type:complete